LKNNGQKIVEKITVKKYLKNNGQKIFEKITVKKYLKKQRLKKIFVKENKKICTPPRLPPHTPLINSPSFPFNLHQARFT